MPFQTKTTKKKTKEYCAHIEGERKRALTGLKKSLLSVSESDGFLTRIDGPLYKTARSWSHGGEQRIFIVRLVRMKQHGSPSLILEYRKKKLGPPLMSVPEMIWQEDNERPLPIFMLTDRMFQKSTSTPSQKKEKIDSSTEKNRKFFAVSLVYAIVEGQH